MLKQQLLVLLILCIQNSSCFMNEIWKSVIEQDADYPVAINNNEHYLRRDYSHFLENRKILHINGGFPEVHVEEVWKFTTIVNDFNTNNNIKMDLCKSLSGENSNRQITIHFKKMQEALHGMEHTEGFKFKALAESLIEVPYNHLRKREQQEIALFIIEVDEKYKDFLMHTIQEKSNVEYLDDLTNSVLFRLHDKRKNTRKVIILPNTTTLLNIGPVIPIANDSFNMIDEQCGAGQTLQNLLITLFKMIMVTELKIYIMQVFSYRFQYIENDGWKSRISTLRTDMKEQFEKYLHAFANSMEIIGSAHLRSCDPKDHSWIPNESFYELSGFHDMGIFKYKQGVCQWQSCNSIWNQYRDQCYVVWFNTRTACNGRVLGCAWVEEMTACVLKEGPRKYLWATSLKMGNFGRNRNHCPKDSSDIVETSMFLNPRYWSTCRCQCLREKGTIYLGQLASRKNLNYVITGLRFKFNVENILFLQPAEGELKANGYISNSSWVPLPGVIDVRDVGPIDPSWSSIFFDDLRLPAGYALTGIQFTKKTAIQRGRDVLINGYSIKMNGVPFDYETGKLNVLPAFERVENDRRWDNHFRNPLPFKKVHPVYDVSDNLNRPSPRTYDYVNLQQTEPWAEFEQSMLPLFDSVPVLTSPASPLGGIGIFHKGSEDNAGFISLRLHPIDYMFYVKEFLKMYKKNAIKMWNV